ncbi:MAG: putative metal-binding motif-containing protein [Nitrospirae bacterium]|nr:putative metal-binding motif-containing protein [Nitrospirota bacterium]
MNSRQSCRRPYGYVANSTDCNDASRRINPGASEVCGDNIDQNCNGIADEQCTVNNDDDDERDDERDDD